MVPAPSSGPDKDEGRSPHGSRLTRDLEELVAYLAQQMDKTAVYKLVGIDWRRQAQGGGQRPGR